VGTTNISPALLARLSQKTTSPPLVLTKNFTTTTTLAPIVPRDDDGLPDLGWHYDVIDYALSGLTLTNATLTLTNGVAVAVFGAKGTTLQNGAKFISGGDPIHLNRLTRYDTVQEQANTNWTSTSATWSLLDMTSSPAALPEVRLRFTDLSVLANSGPKRSVIYVNAYYLPSTLEFTDCRLRGGWIYLLPYYYDGRSRTAAVTNNLVERTTIDWTQGYFDDATPFAVYLRNNLIRNSTVTWVNNTGTAAWESTTTCLKMSALTVPNDPVKYGPWVGKILASQEQSGLICAVASDGTVTAYNLGLGAPEDLRLIPSGQNLYCLDFTFNQLLKVPAGYFGVFVGDILVVDEGRGCAVAGLYIVHW